MNTNNTLTNEMPETTTTVAKQAKRKSVSLLAGEGT